jgi:DNA-binding MarR family transcriptional regulator
MVRSRGEKPKAGGDGTVAAVLSVSAGWVLSRLARQLQLALVPLQLSLSQYRVLGWLARGSTASSMLADKLGVTPPSITGIVDGLVTRGLVERRPDAEDRRRQRLTITAAGKRAFAEADAAVAERLADTLSNLERPDEVEAARRGLDLWQTALDRRVETTQERGR